MPTTKRRNFRRKQLPHARKSMPRFNVSKEHIASSELHLYKQPIGDQPLSAITRTPGFDCNALKFESIPAYNILKDYGIVEEFTKEDKINAIMMYRCLRHLPNFQDLHFTNSAEAILHVHSEAARLIKHSWYLDKSTASLEDIKEQSYCIQIIYSHVEPSSGWWCNYKDVLKSTQKHPDLQEALLICLSVCIHQFGFMLLDRNGSPNTIDFDDWVTWQMESLVDEREYSGTNRRDKKTINKQIAVIDKYVTEYKQIVVPIQEKILGAVRELNRELGSISTKVNAVIERYKGFQITLWMRHVMQLLEEGFCLYNYIIGTSSDSKLNDHGQEEDREDENSTNAVQPEAVYGFIYDRNNRYGESIDNDFNEYVNNYGLCSLSDYMTIDPEMGIIHQPLMTPIEQYLDMIVGFDFKNMKYEDNADIDTTGYDSGLPGRRQKAQRSH